MFPLLGVFVCWFGSFCLLLRAGEVGAHLRYHRCSGFCSCPVCGKLDALTPPCRLLELRAEVDIIEQMSSSSGSSSSDSESSSGSDDDSSSSGGEDSGPASPPQPYGGRPAVANGTGAPRPPGSTQLMSTLSKCTFPLLAGAELGGLVGLVASVCLRPESVNLKIFMA